MVTLKKLKELKQIKRDNKVIYNLLNTIIGECEQISKDPSCSQVMDVIQKMYKDNKQTISECSVDRVDQLNTLNEENAFLYNITDLCLSTGKHCRTMNSWDQINLCRKRSDLVDRTAIRTFVIF